MCLKRKLTNHIWSIDHDKVYHWLLSLDHWFYRKRNKSHQYIYIYYIKNIKNRYEELQETQIWPPLPLLLPPIAPPLDVDIASKNEKLFPKFNSEKKRSQNTWSSTSIISKFSTTLCTTLTMWLRNFIIQSSNSNNKYTCPRWS